MKTVGLILLALVIFVYMNIEIASNNPCSSFSHEQSLCSSDNINR